MNRSRLRFTFVGAIVIVSVATPLLVQHYARIQWREREALLRQQAAEFSELVAENKRLSNLVAQTSGSALSSDQFSELMKLRGEIGRLRQEASEAARLQAAHQQLLTATNRSGMESDASLPDPQTVVAYWPKTQLTSAGYTTPISGLQTALWAMNGNDPNALAASVTPETRSELASNRFVGGTPAERLATGTKWIADSFGPANGFYVVGQDLGPRIPGLNPDLHIRNVYFEREGATRGFALMKIGGEWKVHGIYVIGGSDNEPQLGPRLWP